MIHYYIKTSLTQLSGRGNTLMHCADLNHFVLGDYRVRAIIPIFFNLLCTCVITHNLPLTSRFTIWGNHLRLVTPQLTHVQRYSMTTLEASSNVILVLYCTLFLLFCLLNALSFLGSWTLADYMNHIRLFSIQLHASYATFLIKLSKEVFHKTYFLQKFEHVENSQDFQVWQQSKFWGKHSR